MFILPWEAFLWDLHCGLTGETGLERRSGGSITLPPRTVDICECESEKDRAREERRWGHSFTEQD